MYHDCVNLLFLSSSSVSVLSKTYVVGYSSACLNDPHKMTIGSGRPAKEICSPINYLTFCQKFFLPGKT